jgi:glutamate decarboxylase
MVHLHSVVSDKDAKASLLPGVEQIKSDLSSSQDEVAGTIYGSRFAAQDLPRHEMPEGEMPREVAYRLIKDDLTLDGNPVLNLASFVTTYMVDDDFRIPGWDAPAENHRRKTRSRSS